MPESDPKLVPQTDPTASGKTSTEFKFAGSIAAFGAILAGLGVTLAQLQQVFPESKWINGVMVVVGGLISAMMGLGFIKGQADRKVAMILADSPPMTAPPPKIVVTQNPQMPPSSPPGV